MTKLYPLLAIIIFVMLIIIFGYVLIFNNSSEYYQVVKIVDGDTIDVKMYDNTVRVRLIGIDTPELVDPRRPVECFALEASNKAKEILTNQSVRLETDITQGDRDKYDRLLRYVFLPDGTNVNQLMIAQGYAQEYTYELPYTYQEEFQQAEKSAQDNQLGLWAEGVCNN